MLLWGEILEIPVREWKSFLNRWAGQGAAGPRRLRVLWGALHPSHSAPLRGSSLGIWSPVGSSGQRSPLL